MLACPGCARLVHADQLANLAALAKESTDNNDIPSALSAWREALTLLPPASRQYQIISNKITELGKKISSGATVPKTTTKNQPQKSNTNKLAAGAGAVGLTLWKLKALLLGLTKTTTLLTMLLSLGVYWSIWGWKFALGIVLSIYIHEMGHVIVLRRYGFKATAPTFIPGLGALIRLQQQVVNPDEDAAIGLAGPIYGLGAALLSLTLYFITKQPIFAAIAGVGAWINLFNLLPFGTLDGGRGFHALSRLQKLLATAAVAAAYLATDLYFTPDGLLILIAILCLLRTFTDKSEEKGNSKAALTYIFLVITLTALSLMRFQATRQ